MAISKNEGLGQEDVTNDTSNVLKDKNPIHRSYDNPKWKVVGTLHVNWDRSPLFLQNLAQVFTQDQIEEVKEKPFSAMGQLISYTIGNIENDSHKIDVLIELQSLWENIGWKLVDLFGEVIKQQEESLQQEQLTIEENTSQFSSITSEPITPVSQESEISESEIQVQPIIIDAPNVVRYNAKKKKNQQYVPGRAKLLEIMLNQLRKEYGFSDFRVVLSSAFYLYIDDQSIISHLQSENLAMTSPAGKDDDYYAIETARRVGGLIVTNDNYWDYRENDEELNQWIEQHRMTFTFDERDEFFIFDENLKLFAPKSLNR